MNLIGVKINEAIDANLLLRDLQDWPQVRDALRAVKEIVNTQTAYYLEGVGREEVLRWDLATCIQRRKNDD